MNVSLFVHAFIKFKLKYTLQHLHYEFKHDKLLGNHTLVSSPEHEVLMVSYCGQWLSVVRRRPSCVVRRPSCVNI